MFSPKESFDDVVLSKLTMVPKSMKDLFQIIHRPGISRMDVELAMDRLVDSGQAIKLTVRCGKDTKSYWKLA